MMEKNSILHKGQAPGHHCNCHIKW